MTRPHDFIKAAFRVGGQLPALADPTLVLDPATDGTVLDRRHEVIRMGPCERPWWRLERERHAVFRPSIAGKTDRVRTLASCRSGIFEPEGSKLISVIPNPRAIHRRPSRGELDKIARVVWLQDNHTAVVRNLKRQWLMINTGVQCFHGWREVPRVDRQDATDEYDHPCRTLPEPSPRWSSPLNAPLRISRHGKGPRQIARRYLRADCNAVRAISRGESFQPVNAK
jgi:hypothetical protein